MPAIHRESSGSGTALFYDRESDGEPFHNIGTFR
jgi:hypothetical protein